MKLVRITAALFLMFFTFASFYPVPPNPNIKVATMVLRIDFLKDLPSKTGFSKLVLTNNYKNRTFAKDRVLLEASIEDAETKKKSKTYPVQPIDQLDKKFDKKFGNSRRYSVYQLTSEDIATIIRMSPPGTVYYLLEPNDYVDNPDYLAYTIVPADYSKQRLAFSDVSPEMKGGLKLAMATRTLVLNPSPPATENLSLY